MQFQGATSQRRQTHLLANVAGATPRRLHAIFDALDEATARALVAAFLADYQATASPAVAARERGCDDAMSVLALPAPYRKRLHTTNGVERLNEEIRRREPVIRIFPNRESALRLVGALLMQQTKCRRRVSATSI